MSNPLQYTSRDFNTILADINSDPTLVDKPEWFKRLVAGVGDLASVWENADANESFLSTAITRRSIQDILEPLGYNLTPQISSNGIVLFDLLPATSFPHTLSQSDQVAIFVGSSSISSRRFEGRSTLTIPSLSEGVGHTGFTVATSYITVAGLNYVTGELIQLSTSGTLPSGFSAATNYYAIVINATTIQLASSRANAYAGTFIAFTTQGSGTHTLTRLSAQVSMYQQTTLASQVIGTSDGVSAWQEFNVQQVGIQSATVQIVINGVTWNQVAWLGDSVSTDLAYSLFFETDGSMTVQFGDGVNFGAIPGAYTINLTCAYGGGVGSNVSGVGNISQYGGSDGSVSAVSNPSVMTGGSDPQSTAQAKQIAPYVINAQKRFVTVQDGEALALAYGGLSVCVINPNVYGILSVQVVGIANGGGNPSSTLRTAIAAYLQGISLLDEIYVSFDLATITAQNVTANVHLLTGYSWAIVSVYSKLAFQLVFTETGSQILSTFNSSGIASATVLINQVFGTSFGSGDYIAISKLLNLWVSGQFSPRTFGETIQLSEVDAFVQAGVSGIGYISISAPSFPISLSSNEITTVGTISLSQV